MKAQSLQKPSHLHARHVQELLQKFSNQANAAMKCPEKQKIKPYTTRYDDVIEQIAKENDHWSRSCLHERPCSTTELDFAEYYDDLFENKITKVEANNHVQVYSDSSSEGIYD